MEEDSSDESDEDEAEEEADAAELDPPLESSSKSLPLDPASTHGDNGDKAATVSPSQSDSDEDEDKDEKEDTVDEDLVRQTGSLTFSQADDGTTTVAPAADGGGGTKEALRKVVSSEVTKDRARDKSKHHARRGPGQAGRAKGSKAKQDTRVKLDRGGIWG